MTVESVLTNEMAKIILLEEAGVEIASSRDDKTNLLLLGVPKQFRKAKPSREAFPKSFNPAAYVVWSSVLEEKADKIKQHKMERAWNIAINRYLKECSDLNVNPFDMKTDSTDNSSVLRTLAEQRRQLVRFLERRKIMDEVLLKSPKKDIRVTEEGTPLISVKASYAIRNLSLSKFKRFIAGKGFFPIRGTHWKKINRGLDVYIDTFRDEIKYEIFVGQPLYLRRFDFEEGDEQFDKLARNMWKKVMLQNKFQSLRARHINF